MRALLLSGVLVLAGVTGAALTLAGVHSAATGPLTLAFVLGTPAVCVGLLLGGLDALARVIVSVAASVALAASVAEIMIVTSGWSPDGGVIATAIVSALLVIAAVVLRRRARSPKRAQAAPSPGGEEPVLES